MQYDIVCVLNFPASFYCYKIGNFRFIFPIVKLDRSGKKLTEGAIRIKRNLFIDRNVVQITVKHICPICFPHTGNLVGYILLLST